MFLVDLLFLPSYRPIPDHIGQDGKNSRSQPIEPNPSRNDRALGVLEIEECRAEQSLLRISIGLALQSEIKVHTAVNVAGRKKTETAAIVLIAALSRRVAIATIFESSAMDFIAAFPSMPICAMRTDASTRRMFSALSFCAIRLYS